MLIQRQLQTEDFYAKLPSTAKASNRISREVKENTQTNNSIVCDETNRLRKVANMKERLSNALDIKQIDTKYSVLMSVYIKEDPKFLQESIDSILAQTIPPDEILILKDGPLTPQLEETLENFKSNNKAIKTVSYKVNRGLGPVLADGVILAKNNLIARMDSDDIAAPDRCEMQLECFKNSPNLDIVGCNVTEFMDSIDNIVTYRSMPEHQDDILAFSRKRNPFAHPSVMFKKNSVLNAGNFRDYKYCEDYDLWVRMIQNGAICYNIQKFLVNMRTSSAFYARRGGLNYVTSIVRFKTELLRIGHFGIFDYAFSTTSSIFVGLMPSIIRSGIYSNLLRKK
jgi:glycosyltransferase involved in cell wall biosynthesis